MLVYSTSEEEEEQEEFKCLQKRQSALVPLELTLRDSKRAGGRGERVRQGLEAAGVLELHLLGMRHPLAAKNLCSNLEAGSQLIS